MLLNSIKTTPILSWHDVRTLFETTQGDIHGLMGATSGSLISIEDVIGFLAAHIQDYVMLAAEGVSDAK
jgi:hypothetical protein